ncbi:SRPBCC domain-containing protein [Brevibacterium album]|uniref:SRPBCC domain-containing protein n=1 Tax=Brevibacterium album TaxID=417948 RepID=UPI0004029B55|nr:SRPBCC domain-containing protein [Brevibacterium album]
MEAELDLQAEAGAVVRTVVLGEGTHTVEVSRVFPADRDEVWEACTRPERLRQWFDTADGELRPGGRYALADSGTVGTIEVCERPSRLRLTWEYEDDASTVEIVLAATGEGRTSLALRHIVTANAHWDEFGPAATGIGWEGALLALALHLDGDSRSAPDAMTELFASPPGLEYISRAAEGWGEAHSAAGAEPAAAEAASRKTAAFYRGEG